MCNENKSIDQLRGLGAVVFAYTKVCHDAALLFAILFRFILGFILLGLFKPEGSKRGLPRRGMITGHAVFNCLFHIKTPLLHSY